MLSLSDPFSSLLIKYLVIAKVSRSNEKTKTFHDLGTKIRISAAVSLTDAFIVGGIAFFSSMSALSGSDIIINIKIALYSSITIAGLTFFNEMKRQVTTYRHGSK